MSTLNRQFYLHRGDEQYGPYSEEEIKALALAGQLLEDDLAWTEEMAEWQNAVELFAATVATDVQPTSQGVRGTRFNPKLLGAAVALLLLTLIVLGAILLRPSASSEPAEPNADASASVSPAPSPVPEEPQPEPASREPLVVKGLYLGMPIGEAEEILNNTLRPKVELFCVMANLGEQGARIEKKALLLGEQTPWQYKPISKFFVEQQHGGGYKLSYDKSENKTYLSDPIAYPIIIRADHEMKVEEIYIRPNFAQLLFDTENLEPQEFASQFAQGYKLPQMTPSENGWRYLSDDGWGVEVQNDFGVKMFMAPQVNQFN